MTAAREAVTIPLVFLTVVLLSAARFSDPIRVVPPTLFSLILASLLMAAFVQSGALAAHRLMNAGRSAIENVNGLIVLATTFLATAQILTLVMPSSGVPSVVFGAFMLIGIALMLTASLDRARVLRVLALLLGSALLLKFVVLAAVSAPAQGRITRSLQLLFEGVTLGALSQVDLSPAGGYLAFASVLLYLLGLLMLPSAGWTIARVQDAGRLADPPRTGLERIDADVRRLDSTPSDRPEKHAD